MSAVHDLVGNACSLIYFYNKKIVKNLGGNISNALGRSNREMITMHMNLICV